MVPSDRQLLVFLHLCILSLSIEFTDDSCLYQWTRSFSRVWLFATPWTTADQAPLSMGFSRQEYWSGLPFPSPGDLPNPGIEPRSPALQADSTIWDYFTTSKIILPLSITSFCEKVFILTQSKFKRIDSTVYHIGSPSSCVLDWNKFMNNLYYPWNLYECFYLRVKTLVFKYK